MSIFESESKSPTKMFINIPVETGSTKDVPTRGVINKIVPGGVIIDVIANAAPKLIEQGLAMLSSSINKFAQEDVTKTMLSRNIDILDEKYLSLPSNISIIQGDFAPNIQQKDGIAFGDQGKKQTYLIGHRELHIELEIKKSKDNKSICFQATKFFYNGVDREKETIHELLLAITFVPVDTTIINLDKLEFQSILHFENLLPHTQYEFGDHVQGYDANYQSAWIQPNIDPTVPYTLCIEIQEIREGNSFAKLLQMVFDENKEYITKELEAKVAYLKELNRAKEHQANEEVMPST